MLPRLPDLWLHSPSFLPLQRFIAVASLRPQEGAAFRQPLLPDDKTILLYAAENMQHINMYFPTQRLLDTYRLMCPTHTHTHTGCLWPLLHHNVDRPLA